MKITMTSVASGITRTKDLDVTQEQINRINAGEHIQNVLPHLSSDDREFMLTGITADKWDELFNED
jgi:hypothetical protein